MARPITLFTGQWADLPFEDLCPKAKAWGYDGLEIACWGDPLRGGQGAGEATPISAACWDILEKHGLKCFAISTHLVGQCVCDHPDRRAPQEHPARRASGATATRKASASAPPRR